MKEKILFAITIAMLIIGCVVGYEIEHFVVYLMKHLGANMITGNEVLGTYATSIILSGFGCMWLGIFMCEKFIDQ